MCSTTKIAYKAIAARILQSVDEMSIVLEILP